MIHHDLSWNPSTLEQRTGRVDRIGAKAERCGRPIDVYLPWVAETQDDKMYRVVMDRERSFNVVMGEKYNLDARATDLAAERVPFPECLSELLGLRLEVTRATQDRPRLWAAASCSSIPRKIRATDHMMSHLPLPNIDTNCH
jgi:hypothetical protein